MGAEVLPWVVWHHTDGLGGVACISVALRLVFIPLSSSQHVADEVWVFMDTGGFSPRSFHTDLLGMGISAFGSRLPLPCKLTGHSTWLLGALNPRGSSHRGGS